MADKNIMIHAERIENIILLIRGQRVILDSDLAKIYSVPTKRLNEQVKRNTERFPDDFAFKLTPEEFTDLRPQIATAVLPTKSIRSQIATASKRNIRHLPYVFTEHGAIMAANVLNSPKAIEMSLFVVRAFVKMRETLASNRTLAEKLAELERKLTGRLNVHEKAIVYVLEEIKKLMTPAPSQPVPPKRQIGFKAKEKRSTYLGKRKKIRK